MLPCDITSWGVEKTVLGFTAETCSRGRSTMLRCGKTLVLAVVFAAFFPSTSFVTAQTATPSSSLVRPCTDAESAFGASSEVIRLFADERPTFHWCEAVDVPWLPNAEILRFHTGIHVDYSSVYTVVKAASESPVRLIWAAGEGMVTTPSPSLPNNLDAMNSLLKSVPELKDSQLGSASVLYLFLIHREIRRSLFSKPATSYPLAEDDYRIGYLKRGKSRLVSLSTRTSDWKLTFSSHQDGLHLDSIEQEWHPLVLRRDSRLPKVN